MRRRLAFLLVVAGGSIVATALFAPSTQDPAYHRFADTRTFLGVPNAWDVLSNAGFLLTGVLGLAVLFAEGGARSRSAFESPRERTPWAVGFTGVALTAFGSAYYHLAPDDARLFWDRLPMTVVFGSLLAAVIAERIGERAGRLLLVPLVLSGMASAVYWHVTGELRPYIFAQFFPAIAIPLLFVLFPARYTCTGYWAGLLGWYALAKLVETLDRPIWDLGHILGGHTLKHLAAAAGTWWLVMMLKKRRPVAPEPAAAI